MKNVFKLIFIGGSGFLLSGCLASERDMGTLKLQLKELNDSITVMQANQAELATKMEDLNRNLSVSSENLAQMDAQMVRLSTKLDDLSAVVRPGASSAGEISQQPAGQNVSMLPSDLFAEAKNHLDKGSYSAAVTGFKLYISKYPTGESAEQAYIYLGDAYTGLSEAKPAAVAYATLLQKFPKSKLTAQARVKYARSIVPLGKTDEAKRYLASVVQEFPGTAEASQAQAELAKLN